ncbi:MAG: hypothetical protein GX418_12400 [Clostridiales bacterium]|nr:hypothetical protein [Clostridiales bacterium]
MEIFAKHMPFFKGNLHMHTTRSDGVLSPEAACALYRQHGYRFVSLTDHDTVGADSHFEENLLVLSGIELAFELPAEELHIVGIGVPASLERSLDIRLGPQAAIDTIVQSGGRALLAHPAWSLLTPGTISGLRGLSGAEIYNSMSTAPRNCLRADASAVLDVAAAHGCVLPLYAADDAHFYEGEHCKSYIMAQMPSLTQASLWDALDGSRFYASQGPAITRLAVEEDQILLECSPVSSVIFYSNLCWVGGRCRTGRNLTQSRYDLRGQRGETFVRCQIMDEHGRSAWTNPIIIDRPSRQNA